MIGGARWGGATHMVDVNTAMAAARAQSGKRRRGDKKGKKRPGSKLGVEPFDPAEHVQKEKADTISMWLMITMGLAVGLGFRYLMMPGMDSPRDVLWFLPLALVVIVPSLHKVLIPEPYKSLYTFGNWFRASFLYIFTWLSISFLVVNPPIGDIAAPEVAGKWTIVLVDEDGMVILDEGNLTSKGGEFTLFRNDSIASATIVFAVRDNTDPDAVTLTLSHLKVAPGAESVTVADGLVGDLVSGNSSCAPIWDTLSPKQRDRIVLHEADTCVALDLGRLSIGDYDLSLTLSEQGDPWINSASESWRLTVL